MPHTKLNTKRKDIPNYSIASVMDRWLTEDNKVVSMFFKFTELPTSEDDIYHKVTRIDKYRPDLISYKYYETVDYLWVVLLANSIFDPFDIEIGTILRIPSKSTVVSKWLL